MKGEIAMLGEVIYCQKVHNDRFFVGLKFRDKHIPWSILQRFNGLTHADILGAMRWSDNEAWPVGATRSKVGRKRENE